MFLFRRTSNKLILPLLKRNLESELKASAGISNIRDTKGSKKDAQKRHREGQEDKIDDVVDGTKLTQMAESHLKGDTNLEQDILS